MPTDFSPRAVQALRYAVPLARQVGGKISLLHVLEWSVVPATPGAIMTDENKVISAAQQSLDELARQSVPSDLLERTLVQVGRPPQAIAEAARRLRTDLIVIATQGRTGLKRALLGSTAERVVRHADCPVLTVRGAAGANTPPLRSESLAPRINRILVPVDSSQRSTSAVRFAVSLARRMHARLALLHVVAPLPIGSASHHLEVRRCHAEAKSQARQRLQALAAAVPKDVMVEVFLRHDIPYRGITEAVRQWRGHLVVLPTRGLTAAEYIVLGSTAEAVVRHASCPVLTFKQAPRQW